MTTSGEDGDDTPERDQEHRNVQLPGLGPDDAGQETIRRYDAELTAQLAATADQLRKSLGNEAMWSRIRETVAGVTSPQAKHRVGRDQIVNVNVGTQTHVEVPTGVTPEPAPPKPGLAERRQEFHFDVLTLKMKHAQWMFLFSAFAMAAGFVAVFAGIVLGLVHAGSPSHGYVPYVTGASGLIAGLGGGALNRHAKRTMTDLTEAAKRNEEKIDLDHEIQVATTLIDRVQDKDVKDRLNSAAALKALNIKPNPDMMLNRLLPGDQPKEIEPGDTAE